MGTGIPSEEYFADKRNRVLYGWGNDTPQALREFYLRDLQAKQRRLRAQVVLTVEKSEEPKKDIQLGGF